jgi:hypothetical protein
VNELYLPDHVRRGKTLAEWHAPRERLYREPQDMARFRELVSRDYRGCAFMPAPGYRSLLVGSSGDGTAVTGTTAGSLLLVAASDAVFTLPANYLDRIGKRLRISANGRISNIVTTPGTLTLDIRFGAIIVSTSAAWQLNAVAKTNVAWWLELTLLVKTIGSGTTATIFGQGEFMSESVVGSGVPSAGGAGSFPWQTSAPAVGTGFSTVVSNAVDFFAKFSLTGNSIQCHDYYLESLN